MKKKKILFVIESLACAGAEKSLISLLNLIDYNHFDIELQLFAKGGELEIFLPPKVNVLPLPKFFSLCQKNILRLMMCGEWGVLLRRLAYSIYIRLTDDTHPKKAKKLWELAGKYIIPSTVSKVYDVAIAYAHGVPTYYVASRIRANKKIAWVNGIFKMDDDLKQWQVAFYEKFDGISCVSEASLETMRSTYPQFDKKMHIMWDIVNPDFIYSLASEYNVYPEIREPVILTVARYSYQKGYDVTIEAAKILKDRGIKFKWLALGKGDYLNTMNALIDKFDLTSYFILEGTKSNPYPYFKRAKLYVQTSRNEGYGLSIAEARLLNVPVVTSEFDSVYAQMVQGKNGIVTKLDASTVADAIESLLNDTTKYDSIVEYLKKEKKGNIEELQNFYDLIECK